MTDSDDTTEHEQTYRESQREQMLRYGYWGAFVLLFLFGIVTTVRAYTSLMQIIDIWVAADFEPIFRLLLNVLVTLVVVLGLSVLVRRMDIPFDELGDS
ncbi:hypothetical protein [Halovenus halobia]|uniref:hypothetical protein n=1 Tax=Halovenus halobia TaxID=3396622 RepID=UPI003F546FAE